jgi:hypothetical protein
VLPTPTSAGGCGPASDPGNPDGGVVAGLYWPGGTRKLGESARAYVCAGFSRATATVSGDAGVTVSPSPVALAAGGVTPVSVTARRPGRTTLWLQISGATGNVMVNRPVADVVADRSGWHFAKPSD